MSDSEVIAKSTEYELVLRTLGGDKRAESQLFKRYRKIVRQIVRRRISDSATVEDLTQDIMLACWAGLASIAHPGRFRGWVLGIVYNKLNDHYRRNARARTSQERIEADCAADQDTNNPDRVLAAEREIRRLIEVLRQLPPRTQRLLRYFYCDNLERTEIAAILRIPVGTVGSRLCYARNRLRHWLGDR